MKILINILNILLYPIELFLRLFFFRKKGNRKVLILFGNYASSTTLFLQLICSTFNVNFISNTASKFYISIIFGQLVNKFLVYFFKFRSSFYSEDGNTYGFLEPNEFGWYWRKYFWKNKYELDKFERDINFFTEFSKKPFIFKYCMHKNNKDLEQNYKYIQLIKKRVLIIYPFRPKNLVINSILNRRKNLNNYKSSYNLDIRGAERSSIKKQVEKIYMEHKVFLKKFDKKNILKINFTNFKKNKKLEFKKIKEFLINHNIELKKDINVNKILKEIKFKKDISKV
jgi:hypothetical protein